jgi:LDH2 family malate/lactate/ureidoglycolate dehydrogenase
MPVSYATHRSQLELILRAWGMPEATAASTAEIMSWADLHGIDTHGISMVPPYDERRRAGRIDMRAQPIVARETPVSALIDGGGGLGHANARRAMELAIDKAKATGIGVAAVRNSAHFGACGFYALMAVEAGLIGMVTTSASGIQVAPTFGAQARLGTDPIAFAAPGKPGEPFLLDMATTTVAAGKIRNKANENLPTPPGWLVTSEGKPSTDPREVSKGGFMTPLGGTPEGSSHKGYGLSAMVNILSSALSGASMITDPMHTKRPGTMGTATSCWRSTPACSATPPTSAPTSPPSATRCAPPSPPTRTAPSSSPATPNAAPPTSAAKPASPSAPTFWPRSARSRSPPARSGSWTAETLSTRPAPLNPEIHERRDGDCQDDEPQDFGRAVAVVRRQSKELFDEVHCLSPLLVPLS